MERGSRLGRVFDRRSRAVEVQSRTVFAMLVLPHTSRCGWRHGDDLVFEGEERWIEDLEREVWQH